MNTAIETGRSDKLLPQDPGSPPLNQPTSVGRVCFKCPPEHYEALSRSEGFRPAPYLARAKWVYVENAKALLPIFMDITRHMLGSRTQNRVRAKEGAG